ncbi:MAG: hypothetical protein U0930_15200 [Pirellulales bacterium]
MMSKKLSPFIRTPATFHVYRVRRWAQRANSTPWKTAFGEQMISKAASYFLRPESIDVNQAMVALWNSCDRSFSVSALVACSVLEGLCTSESKDNPGVFSEAQINAIEHFMRSDNFRQIGGQTLDEVALNTLVNRAKGSLSSLKTKSSSSLLRLLCSSSKIGLSMHVFEGWKKLRHRTAHGHFDLFDVSFDERRTLVAARTAVYHGINCLILNKIGYEGVYFHWRDGKFSEFQSDKH